MKITIFTSAEEKQNFERILALLAGKYKPLSCEFYENYDDFIRGFPKDASQAVIVARKGADGMECARNAKLMMPHIPLVWLSDDKGFGIESYRIGCAFFSAEKITESLLRLALARCGAEI